MDLSTVRMTSLDVREVLLYRTGLWLATLGVMGIAAWLGWHGAVDRHGVHVPVGLAGTAWIASLALWTVAVGAALAVRYIHLYMGWLHRVLRGLVTIGLCAAVVSSVIGEGLAPNVYLHTWAGIGYGFILATLCGIAVKEMLCFGRLTTFAFALVTPVLALGHLTGGLSPQWEVRLFYLDCALLVTFAVAKLWQPYAADVGDKALLMRLRGYPLPPDAMGADG
ncbi:MAG TPA: DUF2301 domain-containing membrane protein [bacterium]|jgi:uncharacterized integral membrane protein